MLEMLLSPRKAERHPWEMLFVGLFYASLSILLVIWIFSGDAVLSKYQGILVVTFSVMFSLPFMYYLIKDEEEKDMEYEGIFRILKEHSKALLSLLFLFMGFIIAFSFWHIFLGSGELLQAQIETYCLINKPTDFEGCTEKYTSFSGKTTGFTTKFGRVFDIFANNIYVLIFTLIFSLIFGAGAIFVLAWNASVIAAAIGIFTKYNISQMPLGIARYMTHGLPEIAAYFVAAMAGGIISVAIIKHDTSTNKFWEILQDSLNLIIIAIIILVIAALIEVYLTPLLF